MIMWQIFQGDVPVSSTKNLFWSEGRGTKCRPKFSTHPFFMPLLKDSFSHSSIHSFTHSLIHSFIQSVSQSFIYSAIRSVIPAVIQSFIHSFIHACMHTFIHSLLQAFTHSCIHSFMRACIHSYVPPFFLPRHPVIGSSMLSFMCSFIHWLAYSSFSHSLMEVIIPYVPSHLSCIYFKPCLSSNHFFHPLLLYVLFHPVLLLFVRSFIHPLADAYAQSFVCFNYIV